MCGPDVDPHPSFCTDPTQAWLIPFPRSGRTGHGLDGAWNPGTLSSVGHSQMTPSRGPGTQTSLSPPGSLRPTPPDRGPAWLVCRRARSFTSLKPRVPATWGQLIFHPKTFRRANKRRWKPLSPQACPTEVLVRESRGCAGCVPLPTLLPRVPPTLPRPERPAPSA